MDFRDILLQFKTATHIEELSGLTEEIVELIPQTAVMVGYDQNNRAHQYDLWQHCLHTVLNLARHLDDDMLYLAALLHDIGKPDCRCFSNREEDTNAHYYGHPLRSMEIVRDDVIPTLTANGIILTPDEQRRLLYYVEYHDDRVSLRQKHLRRHLGREMEKFAKCFLGATSSAEWRRQKAKGFNIIFTCVLAGYVIL